MTKQRMQAVRDQLNEGDVVLIAGKVYNGRQSPPKRGRIVGMYSNMAAVRIEGSTKTEMLGLQKLTRQREHSDELEEAPPPPKAPPLAATVEPVRAIVVAPPTPQDDVSAWLDMGRALGGQLREQIASLEEQAAECAYEAERLYAESRSRKDQAAELRTKLAALEAVTGTKG